MVVDRVIVPSVTVTSTGGADDPSNRAEVTTPARAPMFLAKVSWISVLLPFAGKS